MPDPEDLRARAEAIVAGEVAPELDDATKRLQMVGVLHGSA